MSPSFIPQVKLARRPSNARVAPGPACRQVSPSRRAISAGRARMGSALRTDDEPSFQPISAFRAWRSPSGPGESGPSRPSLSTPDGPQSKLRRWPSNASVAPLPALRQTIPSGSVRAVISPPPAIRAPWWRRQPALGRRVARRAIGVAAAEGRGPPSRVAAQQQPSRTSPPGSETRAVYSLAPPPSAASAIVSRHVSRVITATRSGPEASARPRYTKKGGRPHPSSCRRPAKPVCTRPWEPRVASVAEGPSTRRFHSGSWPRQTRTGSPARGAAAARSGSRTTRRALR